MLVDEFIKRYGVRKLVGRTIVITATGWISRRRVSRILVDEFDDVGVYSYAGSRHLVNQLKSLIRAGAAVDLSTGDLILLEELLSSQAKKNGDITVKEFVGRYGRDALIGKMIYGNPSYKYIVKRFDLNDNAILVYYGQSNESNPFPLSNYNGWVVDISVGELIALEEAQSKKNPRPAPFLQPATRSWPVGDKKHAFIALQYMTRGFGHRKDYKKLLQRLFTIWPPAKHPDLYAFYERNEAKIRRWAEGKMKAVANPETLMPWEEALSDDVVRHLLPLGEIQWWKVRFFKNPDKQHSSLAAGTVVPGRIYRDDWLCMTTPFDKKPRTSFLWRFEPASVGEIIVAQEEWLKR